MRPRPVLALAVAVLAATGCAGDAGGGADPSPSRTPTQQTPGEVTTSWSPQVPTSPVGAPQVQARYAPVLDDAAAVVADDDWSPTTTRTEDFEGTCAVTLERTAPATTGPLDDDRAGLVSEALALGSFGDLTMVDDPGGAVRYVALDGADALFELRSKDVTTIAVRVPTTPESCAG